QCHEPWQAGSWKRFSRRKWRKETQSGQVDQRAFIDPVKIRPRRTELWRALHPTLQAHADVWGWHRVHISVLGFGLHAFSTIDGHEHVHPRGPFGVRFQVNSESESLFVDLGGRCRADLGFANKALSLVSENEPRSFNPTIEFAPPIEFCILYLKQIGKVSICLNPDVEVDRFGLVIENLEVFVKAATHGALADN